MGTLITQKNLTFVDCIEDSSFLHLKVSEPRSLCVEAMFACHSSREYL